jgi:ankyrin repeat protein
MKKKKASNPSHGWTFLHWATKNCHINMIKSLLTKMTQKEINQANEDDMTALDIAVHEGRKDVVKLLIPKMIPEVINKSNVNGHTILHWAAKNYYVDIIELLLTKMSPEGVSCIDQYGRTALHYFIELNPLNNILSILEEFLDKMNIDVINQSDDNGQTVLCLAVQYLQLDSLNLLLNIKDIDVNKIDIDGRSNLHYAANKDNIDVVKLLIPKMIPELINQNDEAGFTVLHVAVTNSNENLVKFLLQKMSINAINKAIEEDGLTAFHLAIIFDNEVIVKLFLEKEVDINRVNKYGETALHIAVSYGSQALIKLILETEVDVNKIDQEGITALHWAILHNSDNDIIKLFLYKMNDKSINQVNIYGKTAFHYAVEKGNKEIVKLLLEITNEKIIIQLLTDNQILSPILEDKEFLFILKKKLGKLIDMKDGKIKIADKTITIESNEIIKFMKEKLSDNSVYRLKSYNNDISMTEQLLIAPQTGLKFKFNTKELPYGVIEQIIEEYLSADDLLPAFELVNKYMREKFEILDVSKINSIRKKDSSKDQKYSTKINIDENGNIEISIDESINTNHDNRNQMIIDDDQAIIGLNSSDDMIIN